MNRRMIVVMVVAVALACDVLHAAQPEPLRVLFVGNSYTYFNNMPAMFAALARAAMPGREIETGMVVIPGATLLSLWEATEARRVLRSSRWDYVVLQDQSLLGEGLRDGRFVVNSPSLLHWGVRMFDAEIRQMNARTVVLLTWSRRDEPEQQADLDFAYDSIARDLGAVLAPAGRVWQRLRQVNPDVELYAADGSHPSPVGSYLVAYTVLAALFPEVGDALPSSVSGHPVSGAGVVDSSQSVDLVTLRAEQATQLQSLARSVVTDIRRQGGYLYAARPDRQATLAPTERPLQPDRITGAWTGELTYYPAPAILDVTFRFTGDQCQGEISIALPERKQRYDAPLATCSIAGDALAFSVVTLPMPFLVDRFTGRLVAERLVGTVTRSGRELTNRMSGVWSLRRRAEQRNDPRPNAN